MFRRILCATDGSKRSTHAVKTAAALAHGSGALLTLVHVTPDYRTPYYPDGVMIDWPSEKDYKRDCKAAADKVFAKDLATALKEGAEAETLQLFGDSPADEILGAVRKLKADLIVMASHGRKGFEALLLGSETQKVLARTSVPVLVVR
ncbi:MAG TPA: universal stress protein [Usitatibacteraceae bacterium]|nr:universal stress protein [Usitatibacteraceae bacterium]